MKSEHLYKKDKHIVYTVGDELYPSEIEAGGVYAVQHQVKDKVMARLGCAKYQWGIIVLDHKGDVYRSWNMRNFEAWSTEVYSIKPTWHIFKAPEFMKQFADRSWDADTASAHCKALEEKMRKENIDRYYYDHHWLRRFTNRLINIFSL